MSNPDTPQTQPAIESTESFGDILSQYTKSHSRKTEGSKQLQATVIAVNAESVFFDIGYKSEGILPLAALKTLAATAESEAQKRNVQVTICIMDESGNVLFLQKADGAGLNTLQFAQKKAKYAALY